MCEGPSALGVKVRLVTQSPVASVPLFFWLTVLVTTGVYAQISDSPGSVSCPPAVNLTVTVTTGDGAAVIPNALVILREDTLGQPRGVKVFELELRTDENGKATAAVPCNYLDVFVGHDGFAPVAQKFLITKDAHTFSVPLKMYRWVTRTTEIEVPLAFSQRKRPRCRHCRARYLNQRRGKPEKREPLSINHRMASVFRCRRIGRDFRLQRITGKVLRLALQAAAKSHKAHWSSAGIPNVHNPTPVRTFPSWSSRWSNGNILANSTSAQLLSHRANSDATESTCSRFLRGITMAFWTDGSNIGRAHV